MHTHMQAYAYVLYKPDWILVTFEIKEAKTMKKRTLTATLSQNQTLEPNNEQQSNPKSKPEPYKPQNLNHETLSVKAFTRRSSTSNYSNKCNETTMMKSFSTHAFPSKAFLKT